jgi:hypothetical protein
MNISDYSTKVKNLADVLASIGAPVDDEDLVAVTLNGLGKDYSQFRTSIAVRKTFPNFQDLITLLISEKDESCWYLIQWRITRKCVLLKYQ